MSTVDLAHHFSDDPCWNFADNLFNLLANGMTHSPSPFSEFLSQNLTLSLENFSHPVHYHPFPLYNLSNATLDDYSSVDTNLVYPDKVT